MKKLADQEIIVTNGYFNNIRLFGTNSTIKVPAAAAKRDDPYTPTYGLKIFFEQWDEVGHPIDGNIGHFTSTEPEPIPQLNITGNERFDNHPVVFSPTDLRGRTLLQVISEVLPTNAGGDITEPEFQGFVPGTPGDPETNPPTDPTPPYNPPDSPYLMNLTLGTVDPPPGYDPDEEFNEAVKVRYTGHEDTRYEFEEDGTIKVHWEGESWMYFVGVPNSTIMTDPNVPPQSSPDYPSYPTRLIYQFVFTEPQNTTGTPPAYPGVDGPDGDIDDSTNKWITESKLLPIEDSPNKYLPITLSWERLKFDYEVRTQVVKGVNRQVVAIKNLKRLGR